MFIENFGIIVEIGEKMGKIDKIKEKINLLKFWLGIFVATFLAIIGWGVTNYAKTESWLLALSILSIILLSVLILIVSKRINKKINDLEDL